MKQKCYLEKLSGVGSLSRLRQDAIVGVVPTVETKARGENLVLLGYNAEELSCMLSSYELQSTGLGLLHSLDSMGLGVLIGDQLLFYPFVRKGYTSEKRPSQLKHLVCLMHRALVSIFQSL